MTRSVDVTEADETTGRLASSAFLLVVRRVLGSGLSAISAVVVVRSLAPDKFGQYAAGLSAYYLLVALTEFGFGEVLGRRLGRGSAGERSFGRMLLVVNTAWSGIVAIVGIAVAGMFAFDSIRGATLLVLTPAIALAGTNSLRQFFYARHEVGRMAAVDLSAMLVSTAAIVGLAVAGAPAVVLAAVASGAAVVTSLLVLQLTWQWIRQVPGEAPEATVHSVRALLANAFPIGLASVLATAYVSIDVVLLSIIFPPETVGQYATALKVF
jgi:polysaccharide transporter, PST family